MEEENVVACKVFICRDIELEDKVNDWIEFWIQEINIVSVTQTQQDDIVTLVLFFK